MSLLCFVVTPNTTEGRSRASSSTTLDTAGAASNSTRESVVPVAPSASLLQQPTLPSGQSGNTLTVPSTSQTANSPLAPPTTSTRGQPMGSLGAIPRTSEHAQESEARSCFCGHYSEAVRKIGFKTSEVSSFFSQSQRINFQIISF